MAITAQNVTYVTAGPAATGQIITAGPSQSVELAYIGTATFTLDGSTTTATLNYIDGTAALPFTPSGIIFSVCGGTATVVVNSVVDAGNSNKTATVTFSGAGSNAQTIKIAFIILK